MKICCALLLFVFSLHAEMQTLKEMPRIYLIPDFLSPEECDHMIKEARSSLAPSTVTDEAKPHEGKLDWRRSSQGMFFPSNSKDRILRRMERRIADLTGLPVENGEAIQVLWYQVGGEYQPHYDYFSPNTPGGAAVLERGGQRVATLIMYLNTPEAGGETIFPKVNISVIPKKGTALLFYNCNLSGEVDPLTLHGGAPVKAGEKWIATKWIRMSAFH
jgi:prolyl 4-hydroxylase